MISASFNKHGYFSTEAGYLAIMVANWKNNVPCDGKLSDHDDAFQFFQFQFFQLKYDDPNPF